MNKFRRASQYAISQATSSLVFITLLILLASCSGSGDSNDPGRQDDGGSVINAPDGTGSGGTANDGGSSGSGTNTGSDSSSGGSSDTGTGGDSDTGSGGTGDSGGSSGGGAVGNLAALYVNTGNIALAISDCTTLPASLTFPQAVFALINQSGGAINAAITLNPDSTNTTALDQMVLTLAGQFSDADTITGSFTAISSLNNQVVAQSQGNFIILIIGSIISVELVGDNAQPTCSLTGGMLLEQDAGSSGGGTGGSGDDTGGGTGGDTGGGTGGDTGGGTGGDTGGSGGDTGGGSGGTGGSTGGSSDVLIITEEGDFGSLQFQSNISEDNEQQFDTISATFMRIPDGDFFVWSNGENVAVQVNFISGNTVVKAFSGKDYSCNCFPLIDLANRQVTFNNFTLMKVADSLTLNGSLGIPQFNQP